jgi:hypothetical protein
VVAFDAGAVAGGLHMTWTPGVTATDYFQAFLVGPCSQGITAKFEKAIYKTQEPITSGGVNLDSLSPGRYTVFARVLSSTTGLVSTMVSSFGDVT